MTVAATPAPPSPFRLAVSATLRAFNVNKTSWIGLGVFLFVITVLVNVLARLVVNRAEIRMKGAVA